MERDLAIRLDGMLLGARANLNGIAHYMKNNLPEAEFKSLVISVGTSMYALCEISNDLHRQFPDIVPAELRPPGEPEADGVGSGGGQALRREPTNSIRVIQRDVATRFDGMLMGAMGNLGGIAQYIKNNLTEDEGAEHLRSFANSISALDDISYRLHKLFPDIVPAEMQRSTGNEGARLRDVSRNKTKQPTKLPAIIGGQSMSSLLTTGEPKAKFFLEAETGEIFEVDFSLHALLVMFVFAQNWPAFTEELENLPPKIFPPKGT
jgi:hypothetical protein